MNGGLKRPKYVKWCIHTGDVYREFVLTPQAQSCTQGMSGKSLGTFIHHVVVPRALESKKVIFLFTQRSRGPTLTLASYAGHLRVSTGVDDIGYGLWVIY